MAEPAPESGDGQPTAAKVSSDVFISYASQDAVVANSIVGALEKAGLRCWIAPRDVVPGEFYADAIVHAIDAAKVIVLTLSENAAASPHVLREVERASSKRHAVVSFRVDLAPLPASLEYFLNTSHWLDASATGVDRALPKLVDAVHRAVAPASGDEHTHVGVSAGSPLPAAPHPAASTKPTRRPSLTVVTSIAATALILAYFIVDRFWLPKRPSGERPVAASAPVTAVSSPAAPAVSDRSVAVLPFVDMSEKKDQEYFSDGLSEELIDHLARTPDLKVIARTSSFQFKNKNDDVRTIGQRLGVANLLEGSVRTSGKTLRVTAQLIRASDGSHIWSQSYDRDRTDIFKVQDEITTAVVIALQAAMSNVAPPIEEVPTNKEAYSALLRGRYFDNRGRPGDNERAIAAFQEAIKLEPRYAIAWSGLARAYNGQGLAGAIPPKEAYALGRQAVDQALTIDPNLASAHRALAALEWNYNRDFEAAGKEERRARELDPSRLPALRAEGFRALASGQFEKAVGAFQQVVELNPLDSWSHTILSFALFAADRLSEAERVARDILDLDASLDGAHCNLGEVLLAKGNPDAALTVMNGEAAEDTRAGCLPDALWALGRRAEADELLGKLKTKYASSRAFSLAESYALRIEKDEAFKWLDRAYDNREPQVTLMKADPMLRSLRGDPRFTELLRKMKLPE